MPEEFAKMRLPQSDFEAYCSIRNALYLYCSSIVSGNNNILVGCDNVLNIQRRVGGEYLVDALTDVKKGISANCLP